MTTYNLTPKTRRTLAERIRVGDVVMESHEHPALVTHVGASSSRVVIHARYIWQPDTEYAWKLGVFRRHHKLNRATRGQF